MEMSALALGRSGAARCGREKQVRGGRRRLTRSGETELMKWRRRATSGATNEAAAEREGTAEEPADSSVLMRSVQGGEPGLLPVPLRLTLRSHWLRTKETLPCEV